MNDEEAAKTDNKASEGNDAICKSADDSTETTTTDDTYTATTTVDAPVVAQHNSPAPEKADDKEEDTSAKTEK